MISRMYSNPNAGKLNLIIEKIVDGNGRMGRVLINLQLMNLGFPPIIIQNIGEMPRGLI